MLHTFIVLLSPRLCCHDEAGYRCYSGGLVLGCNRFRLYIIADPLAHLVKSTLSQIGLGEPGLIN